jgi:hypothetical protein
MPSVSDTAYPRFKINPSAKELNELYTPTVYELAFARERAFASKKPWRGLAQLGPRPSAYWSLSLWDGPPSRQDCG